MSDEHIGLASTVTPLQEHIIWQQLIEVNIESSIRCRKKKHGSGICMVQVSAWFRYRHGLGIGMVQVSAWLRYVVLAVVVGKLGVPAAA